MATLNTSTSVVDYIKSTGGDSSFSARAKKAVELGLVKSTDQYTGSSSQNTSLLKALQGSKKTSPSQVGSQSDVSSFINDAQGEDIVRSKSKNDPETRGGSFTSSDLIDTFKELTGKSSIVPDYKMPDAPNFEATFQQLRGKYGVDALETSINDLDAQQQDLEAQLRISRNAEIGKPVALNVIEGRVSEQERNFNERIDYVSRQKARAVAELQTANDAIENIMNFRKMDYDVAKDAYNTEFSNNLQLFNTIKGLAEFEITESERVADNARANLQIIYNSIKDTGDISTIDDATAVKINKLELQAGLPQGFYQQIALQKPEADVLSTTTRETGGVKYADVLFKNADGSISTQSIKLGASKTTGSDNMTEAELLRAARSDISGQLNNRTGQDGYVAPADYKKARSAWVSKGFAADDFDKAFANEYANPDHIQDYGVTLY